MYPYQPELEKMDEQLLLSAQTPDAATLIKNKSEQTANAQRRRANTGRTESERPLKKSEQTASKDQLTTNVQRAKPNRTQRDISYL